MTWVTFTSQLMKEAGLEQVNIQITSNTVGQQGVKPNEKSKDS